MPQPLAASARRRRASLRAAPPRRSPPHDAHRRQHAEADAGEHGEQRARAAARADRAAALRRSAATSGTRRASSGTPAIASHTPSTPPARASSRLSVSSWRTSRSRPAPSAVRTASSLRRTSARASSRFARLVQAISRTHSAAPSSASSSRRAARRHLVAQPDDAGADVLVLFGIRCARGRGDACASRRAPASIVTPGRRRPTTYRYVFVAVLRSCSASNCSGIQNSDVARREREARAASRRSRCSGTSSSTTCGRATPRIAAEARLPEPIAEDHRARRAARLLVGA